MKTNYDLENPSLKSRIDDIVSLNAPEYIVDCLLDSFRQSGGRITIIAVKHLEAAITEMLSNLPGYVSGEVRR